MVETWPTEKFHRRLLRIEHIQASFGARNEVSSFARPRPKLTFGGGVRVLQLCPYRGRLQRCIAAATAYFLALHLVLSALIVGHFAPLIAVAPSDAFLVCHGAGNNEPDRSAPESGFQHCVLCTLANDTVTVLPRVTAIANLAWSTLSHRVILRESQALEFVSFTAEYPRGPPARGHLAG
jgi:hypothetical protein